MDFSQMDIQQLLKILKTQSPTMYDAVSSEINSIPGDWSALADVLDPEDPFGYVKDLRTVIGRGYDPNLIVDEALGETPMLDDVNNQNRILVGLSDTASKADWADTPDNEFPSKHFPFFSDYMESPAARSAGVFLNNIPDSELDKQNLWFKNGLQYDYEHLSDEDLLKLLLKNKA